MKDKPKLKPLEAVKCNYVLRVLAECGDNVSEAARRMSLHRRSLQRWLSRWRKLGIAC